MEEYRLENKLDEGEHLIKQKFNEFESLVNEYNELKKNFDKKSESSNEQLFLTHPELFFSVNQIRFFNILSLVHSTKYRDQDYFYTREKVNKL